MAHFLYEKNRPCYHEKSQEFSSVNEIAQFVINRNCGIADTGLILLHDHFEKYPINCVLVLRDFDTVCKELETLGIPLTEKMKVAYEKAIASYRGPVITFDELKTEEGVQRLCGFINVEFDKRKYDEFKDTQIQPFVKPMVERARKNLPLCKELLKEFL
jgi:hypothetical protein